MEQLTEKERLMLQDQLRHEQVCISKYRSYAGRASPAIRDMFNEFAQDEENHFRTLKDLLAGKEQVSQEFSRNHGSTPVDAFGRQTNWQGTASQILFERAGGKPYQSSRDHQWGGLLPGDVDDTNHGDLTRGGLGGRGVRLLDQHEGYPPRLSPHTRSEAHVMPSRVVRDGENAARVWGDRDDHPVGSERSGAPVSDTRFIYGGQEPRDVQLPPPATQYQTWRGRVPGSSALRTTGQAGAWLSAPVTPTGPVSVPSTRVEAAAEWDGFDLSPWYNLTSPSPLDGDTAPYRGHGGQAQRTPLGLSGAGEDDRTMLTDMLMTEKYISSAYDSAVFDSANPQVRQALQHIQKDEQRHGQRIAQEMQKSSPQTELPD
ncbi:MAG: spore coat protein [Bacillota bacterium]